MDWYSVVLFQNLPSFGPYLAKRQEVKDKLYKEKDLLSEKNMPEPQRPANAPKKPVPRVKVSHPNKSLLTKALIEFFKTILVCLNLFVRKKPLKFCVMLKSKCALKIL